MATFSASKLDSLLEELHARSGRRWSIRQIAKATDISSTYLILLKNGQRKNPSMDIVIKLSQFFQVAPEELLELDSLLIMEQQDVVDCTTSSLSIQQMKQTLKLSEQLIASNNPHQAFELLQLLMPTATCCPSHELWFEIQLLISKSMMALGQEAECLITIETYLRDVLFAQNHGQLLYIRGRLFYKQGLIHKAISDFLSAISHAEHLGDTRLLYRLHYALGICYKDSGEYVTSLHHYHAAIEFMPYNLQTVQKAHLHMGIGITHLMMKNAEEARRSFSLSESLYQEAGELKYLADLQHNKALVSACLEHYEEAVRQFELCLQAHQNVGDHFGIASDLWELALCYKHLHEWAHAQEYALRASITFENANQSGPATRAKLLLIEAKMHVGEQTSALLAMIDQVSDIFRTLKWDLDFAKALRVKASIVQQLGESEQALKLSLQAFDLFQAVANL